MTLRDQHLMCGQRLDPACVEQELEEPAVGGRLKTLEDVVGRY